MDIITKIGDSLIQHGKGNNRIYLMKLAAGDYPRIVKELDELAAKNEYTKVFCKIPADYGGAFLDAGYGVEAEVPGLFNGRQSGLFLAKYLDAARLVPPIQRLREMRDLIANVAFGTERLSLPPDFRYKKPGTEDTESMARLYRSVFTSYPFPIDQPEYLCRTMQADVEYFGIWEGEAPVALSSAEMDLKGGNVEMTDFAVLPKFRGRQFSLFLLRQMEAAMRERGLETAYTIARLNAPGMNITFYKNAYRFSGTLINNTNICGSLESMNVWYKSLNKMD
jgi:putative beta-lysine N-acetyltransferase